MFVENNPDIQTKPQPVWIAVPAAAIRKKKTHYLAFAAMKKCVSVRQIKGARNEGGSFMRKKSFKSALAVLLSLMMILVLFPANAFAMEGEGTTDHPYKIATAEELYEFANIVNERNNTACAVLTADITLSSDTNWTPIGNYSNQYKGTFDGGGHTITGLSVDIQSDNTIYAGLFGYIGEGGTIKNVGLEDSKITCSSSGYIHVGGVCGFNGGTIENCYNTGDVSGTGTSSYGDVYAGGVCGLNYHGTIQNCYNTGDVSGTGTSSYGDVYAGGVCGLNYHGTIQNCYNTGDVSGTGTSSYGYVYAGGVCGYNAGGTIENCYNTGDVSGIYGFVYAGGVCGFNTGTIENCHNAGEVSGTSTSTSSYDTVFAGGVCGYNAGTIQNCHNTGDVSGTSTSSYGSVYAGGVCGQNYHGTIQNCYNTGDVSGTSTSSYDTVFAGGVCGQNYRGTIQNCHNTEKVSGTSTSSNASVYAGGVCGDNENSGTIQNCHNTGKVSGTSTSTFNPVYAGGVCGASESTITNCYWLAGTADYGIGNPRGDTNAQSKTADEFASGEVAWLLNEPQAGKPWGQGSNNMPVLEGNLPDGVTSKTPVRITIVMTDSTEQYRYTTEGSTVAAYPTGYAFFFKDGDTKTWINKGTRTYDADATIYAENMTLEKIPEKAATCTADGHSAYWYCAAFDKYFSDENGVNEITAKDTVIPATGHDLTNIPAKEPTCTKDGNIEYWYCEICDKYFSDKNAETEIRQADTVIAATGHSYENGKCTVCGEIDPDFKAVIIEGANGTWQKGTKDGLSFTSNAAFADFQKVQVDGKDLDASNYTVKEGSTIVTLKAEYLETLSVGKHTLAIVSDTGTATTEFTIKAAAVTDDTQSPQTGDDSNVILWIALLLLSGGALCASIVNSKKKSERSR